MEQEVIHRLIDLIERVSPELWEIGMKQVQASVATSIIGIVLLLITAIGSGLVARWGIAAERQEPGADYDIPILGGMLSFVLALFAVVLIAVNMIGPIMNPEFHAIRHLTSLLGLP